MFLTAYSLSLLRPSPTNSKIIYLFFSLAYLFLRASTMYFQALSRLATLSCHVCACKSLRIITYSFSDNGPPKASNLLLGFHRASFTSLFLSPWMRVYQGSENGVKSREDCLALFVYCDEGVHRQLILASKKESLQWDVRSKWKRPVSFQWQKEFSWLWQWSDTMRRPTGMEVVSTSMPRQKSHIPPHECHCRRVLSLGIGHREKYSISLGPQKSKSEMRKVSVELERKPLNQDAAPKMEAEPGACVG